jgi:sensor histidine kinase regulating citrate/malate metabolism
MNRINKLILFYKNLCIKDKITLANVVVIGIIALFIFFFFPARIKREGIKNLEDKAYSISQILAINSIAALEFSDTLSLNENVSSIRNDKDVAYVVVLDQSKNPISNYTLHKEYSAC